MSLVIAAAQEAN
uniref:Uncharacterized protein n=1 Tax=Rhizophora mucronata TaxID=61149 RepID=A0A2P2Q569_RHIMU